MKLFSTLFAAVLVGAVAPAYSQVAFQENFEGVTTPALPTDWANKTAGSGGWKTNSGQITFISNWKIPATSKYAVVDDYNNTNDVNNPSRLTTPNIDISALTLPVLSFKYYFVNAQTNGNPPTVEAFSVEASTDSGKTWKTVQAITAGNPTQWQNGKIALSDYIGEDALMLAFTFSDKGIRMIGAAVDDIKIEEYNKPYDAALQVLTPSPAAGMLLNSGLASGTVNFGGTIYNDGFYEITAIKVHYQEGNSPVVTDNISGLSIPAFKTGTFTMTTPFTFPATVGEYPTKVWLELVGDTTASNDSTKTAMYTVGFLPKKRILAEEGTGTWCGYCPRGHVFMDSLAAHPLAANFSLVAVHNADPMTVPAYDSKMGSLIGGYPSMSIDRRDEVDPSALFQVYAAMKDYYGYADITVSEVPVGGFNYSLKVTVKPAYELGGDYRLAVALTEDDVRGGPDGSNWDQANYYSNQYGPSTPLIGAGLNWYNEPAKVPASKMHYNHVARGIFPNANGAQGSLPNMMMPNTNYDYTFNIPMEPWWNRNNMHAIVMLIRNSDGQVLNSNNLKVSVGVSDVQAGVNELTVFPNPATNNAYINFNLAKASDVNVVVTDMMGRTVQSLNKENFSTGAHKINVDLSAVAAGVYNVTLQTEGGSITTRLSVVK